MPIINPDQVSSSGTTGMPEAPTNGYFVASGSSWIDAIQTVTSSSYTFSTDTTRTDPTVGFVKVNNSDFNLASEIYIHRETLVGRDIEPIIQEVVVGDIVRLGQADSGNYVTGKINTPPIDNGDWWVFSFDNIASAGGITQPLTVALDLFTVGDRNIPTENIILSQIPPVYTTFSSFTDALDEDFTVDFTLSKITFCFEPSTSRDNRTVIVGLFIDDVLVEKAYDLNLRSSGDKPYVTKVLEYTFPSTGVHNIKVKFYREGGGSAIASLESIRVFIEELNKKV